MKIEQSAKDSITNAIYLLKKAQNSIGVIEFMTFLTDTIEEVNNALSCTIESY